MAGQQKTGLYSRVIAVIAPGFLGNPAGVTYMMIISLLRVILTWYNTITTTHKCSSSSEEHR